MEGQTIFCAKPALQGERVLLRPFLEEDIPVMLKILDEADVKRLTGSVYTSEEANRPMDDAERERTIAWYRTRGEQPDRLDLAIVRQADGQVVGEAVLNDWDEDCERCNFRILIGQQGQNGGLGSEATQLMVEYALDVLGLHRVDLTVFAFNPRAQRVYEKAGFVLEGTRREVFRFDGVWYDERIYSIIAPERA